MGVLIFNPAGLAILLGGFLAAFAMRSIFGLKGEAPVMMIGGALIVILDLAYRYLKEDGDLIKPQRGGSLFFLPAWCLGALWLVIGIVRAMQ